MKYHFIGDQGVSMKGLKRYMEHLGHETSGSDLKSGGHKASNITADVDLVVRSSAINPGSEGWKEVAEADRLGIKVIKRSELLGQITKDKKLIAVSGMHGKTTITSMAGLVLIEAGLDPTVLVGDGVIEFKNDVLKIGKSDWFVAEICEYDRSFLDIYPKILILSNIDKEHLDTYPGGLPEIKEAFLQYIDHVPDDGVIIACHDDQNVLEVLQNVKTKASIIYYGKTSDKYNKLDFTLGVPGQHNILNALSVVALADHLNIEKELVEKVLKNFHGAKRRFEYKGNFQDCDLIDDYGHHPTEIKAAIEALVERYSDKKRIVVFWPHQYKRIMPLLSEFSEAFDQADEVIIKPIYLVPGRDEKLDISSEDIAKLIENRGTEVKVMETDQQIINYLTDTLDNTCVLLTIGIPPVYKIAEELAIAQPAKINQ